MASDFSIATQNIKKQRNRAFKFQRESAFQHRSLYPAKLAK